MARAIGIWLVVVVCLDVCTGTHTFSWYGLTRFRTIWLATRALSRFVCSDGTRFPLLCKRRKALLEKKDKDW